MLLVIFGPLAVGKTAVDRAVSAANSPLTTATDDSSDHGPRR